MSIACGHCKGRHDSVAEVRRCSGIDSSAKPVSSWSLRSPGESPVHAAAVHAQRTGYVSPEQASAARVAEIGDVVNRQNGHVPNQAADAPVQRTKTRAAEGMYRKAGTIYKVQKAVHGSGQNYAKRLVQTLTVDKNGKPKWTFEYAPGFVYELRAEHALTFEQAKEFGALYGTCCVCGRTLTKEESIEAGIGPICATKF
jgi:hypothetical protein